MDTLDGVRMRKCIENYFFGIKISTLHIQRKISTIFVIFSEIMLDNWEPLWYIIQARDRDNCARNAMMQEIAPQRR